jgi:hypothetical protein
VAFSLAGGQRQLVLPIAEQVEATLGRATVFYDAWYEHWLDVQLAQFFDRTYQNYCDQ